MGGDVARRTLDSFESQANLSVLLAAVGTVATLTVVVMILAVFDPQNFWIPMRAGGPRYYAILGASGLAMISGAIGFLLAFNSAGQKRNTRSSLSWMGFFLNSAVITIAACVFVFFWFFKFLLTR
jgi:hypothetical protein